MKSIDERIISELAAVGHKKGKKKKARTTFTGRQIFELEKRFEIKKYLSSTERSELAKLLNVTETQVIMIDFLFTVLVTTSNQKSIAIYKN